MPRRSSRGSTTRRSSKRTSATATRLAARPARLPSWAGKTATTDGPVRFTAPSLVFEPTARRRLVAGGFQPVEAYDVLVANLDPTLYRQSPPDTPAPLLERFPDGLTTQEVAALMTHGNDAPDRAGAEAQLLELVGGGKAVRVPLGDDALWQSAPAGCIALAPPGPVARAARGNRGAGPAPAPVRGD